MIQSLFKKYGLTTAGLIIGALAGYLYYHFIGCASGSCPITSKPLNSTIYGTFMGMLGFSMLKKESKKQ